MIVKTNAIVLKRIPYNDTGFIVQLFTEQLGRQSILIKGSRTQKSKFKSALFQPLTLLSCEFNFKEHRSLHSLNEVQIEAPFNEIYQRIDKSSTAIFICEVLTRTIKEEGPQEDLFHFLYNQILHLESTTKPVANLPLFFLIRLLPFLGFKPGDNYSEATSFFNIREGVFMPVYTTDFESIEPENALILFKMMRADIDNYHTVQLNNSARTLLTQKISDYYSIHVENFGALKSLPILHDVFN